MSKARALFTDSYNSLWHVLFGISAYYFWFIAVAFILYQLIDPFDKNIMIDLSEFLIGYIGITVVILGAMNPPAL